jgi:hypothetical protein
MTDKEIRRMKDGVMSIFEKFNILDHASTIGSLRDDILRLIGSMQERPGLKFNVGDKVRNDKIAGLPICTIESIDDTTYYCDYTNFDIIVQDKWELVVEPKDCMYSKDNFTDEDRKVLCDGCEEKCKYDKSDDFTKALAECIHNAQCNVVDPMVFAETWKDELIKLSKCEEPVSEDLEEEIGKYCSNPENFITYIDVGFKQSPIEKDDIPLIIKAIKFGANWQKHKDESYTKSMYKVGINTGKELMEQQMMAKAVDSTVHIDAGGYPYIPQMELYDYDKDIPLAKEGEKVKVIVIKED